MGGFAKDYYWTSTEYPTVSAFAVNFGDPTPGMIGGGGTVASIDKRALRNVRAVRAF